MKKILDNPNDKLIAVDMDGTLCTGEWWGPECGDPKPIQSMIDLVNGMYKKGAHIVIYTARFPEYYTETLAWLIKHKVLFHGINMRVKPGADAYMDDRALNVDDINEYIEAKKKTA